MKKFIIFLSILFTVFFSHNSKSQTIDSVSTTVPILCYGDLATVNVYITQTSPATPIKLMNYRFATSTFLVSYGSSAVTTGTTQPFSGMIATNYRMLMVDSASFWSAFPPLPGSTNPFVPNSQLVNPSNPAIIGYQDYTVLGVPVLSATTLQTAFNGCFGDCNANQNISVLGGTPPYNITITGPGLVNQYNVLDPLSIDTTYQSLCAGTYTYSVSDVNGCLTTPSPSSFSIGQPTQLSVSAVISSDYNGRNVSCYGASDGEITAVASGGTAPYQYSLDGSSYTSDPVFSSLSSGVYTVYYKDANNCLASENITINDPPTLSGAISVNQSVTCYSACDGSLQFIVDNIQTGTAPYTYSIDGGLSFQNSNTFSSLCGGTNYSIIVKDVNGCTFSSNIFLSEPTEILFNVTSSDFNGFGVSCYGSDDGEIIIFAPSGGTPNYDYSINGGASYSNSLIYNNLTSGNYVVTVRDIIGCTSDTTVVITEPNQFDVQYTSTSNYNGVNVSCYGSCDGSISIAQSNGVGVVSYSLSGSVTQTAPIFSGLCGQISNGSYNLIAIDDNGCVDSVDVNLTEPQQWVYSVDSIGETCNLSNGQASINIIQGGTGSLAYLWNDPNTQITSSAINLETGIYNVTVTDINGCNFTEDVFVAEADITLSFDSIPPCNGLNNGSATVIPDGTPPYQVIWFNGSTSNTISGLSPGYYSVSVIDGTGCLVTDSVLIPNSVYVDLQLDSLNSILSVNCNGDQSSGITLNATGGTGSNTYLYYIPNTFPIPQASNVFSGLYAGNYVMFTEDANGCTDSLNVTINQPDEVNFYTSISDVSCFAGNDGSLSIDSVTGGTSPFNYFWNNGSTTSSINGLTEGDYIISITDANGCISSPTADTLTVSEPTILQSSISITNHATCTGAQTLATGELNVTISGGTPGYSYSWSNGETSNQLSFLMPDLYVLNVTDNNGCLLTDSAEILPGQNPQLDVLVQNVSCFGANDGMIYTSAIGGTLPYQYSSDGGNTFVPSGTPFGPSGQASYFITVVDALGCTDSDSIYVNEPDLLAINNIIEENVSCYDSANGKLTVFHSGGTTPFTYSWSDPLSQSTMTANNLSPGNYNVIVTDTNGCSDTSISALITQPDSLYLSISSSLVSCYGGTDGSASLTAFGGTPNYSYLWSNGSNTSSINNVPSLNYTVTVTDDNGCTRLGSVNVTQPQPISNIFIRDSVTCVGGNDGFANALTSGGTPPFSYVWSNNQTTNPVNNLFAGLNYLQITDTNGCAFNDTVNILEPSQSIEIDSAITSSITCYGANNGTIAIIASGGDAPYLYSIDNGFSSQSNIGFINIVSGYHILYVEDQRGCVDRDTVNIDEPDSLYIDSTIYTNTQCYSFCNGSIQSINAIGGTQPYTYSVNGGLQQSSMAYFNNYCAGTYTVEVFDENNCVAQDLIIIDEPSELNVQITTSDWNNYQVRCNGENSGYADFTISGGISPYVKTCIEVATGDTIQSSSSSHIDSISAGLYRFIVEDSRGCVFSTDIVYYEPDPIVHSFVPTHVSCNGWNNGALIDIVSGGVGTATSYVYSWNTGDSTYSISNLSVGTYTITVVDENNCASVDSYNINNSLALSASINNSLTSNVSCFDFCDGIISLNVSGGIPNIDANGNPIYTYSWDDVLSQNTITAIGLCVDNNTNNSTYSCIVSDSQGCNDTVSYTLNQPEELVVTASILTDILCFGDSNGRLTASATGGNGGKQYLWNNANNWNNNPVNNNLSSASYVVVVRDNKGCMDTTEIFLPQPNQLVVSTTQKNVSCFGDANGEITAIVTGGTPTPGIPPTYNYNWSPSNQTTQTAINLDSDIYIVTVTDNNNCSVVSNSIFITQPSNPLSLNVDSTDETCLLDNGTATAFVNGGTQPFDFSWTNSSGGSITQGTGISSINNLSPGLYNVEISDKNGCIISGSTFVNGVKNIFLPGNLDKIDTVICLGKSLYVDVEEKPGFIYDWTPGPNTSDVNLQPTTTGLHNYILSVTEPGCNPYELEVNINVEQIKSEIATRNSEIYFRADDVISPDKAVNILSVVSDESITISSNPNLGISHEWVWDQGTSTESYIQIPNIDKNKWIYLKLDSSGCLGYDSVYVALSVIPFDAISPNGDMKNDTWNILGITANRYDQAIITIYNRWGEEVYKTYGGSQFTPWDGTKDGNELPVGTYYYIIDLADQDEPITGPVTIIR